MEVSQRINKLIDENEDYATVPDWEEIVKLLRPFGGRTANEYRQRLGMPDHTPQQSSKEEYNKKWKYRENLRNVALMAIKNLLIYDRDTLLDMVCTEPNQTTVKGLPEAIRACAPLIKKKGDWAALWMLCQERHIKLGCTDLCRMINQYAPEAPQPKKQHISAASTWTPKGKFPDWKPTVHYNKFRKYYMIAQKAAFFL